MLLWIIIEFMILFVYSFMFLIVLLVMMMNLLFGLMFVWVLVSYEFFGKKILDVSVDFLFVFLIFVGGLILMIVFSDKGCLKFIFFLLSMSMVFGLLGVFMVMIFVFLFFVVCIM